MPKIRCKHCEAVLNLPEKALGKVITCPKCSEKMKVPGGSGAAGGSGKSSKKAKAATKAADDPFGFGGLDDYDLEDEESQICPYCANDMEEEEVVCRKCGMNIETGQLDAKVSKKLNRKGPDPEKYFKAAWGESWQFMLSEPRLAVRLGVALTFFSTLALMCGYMGFVYVQEQMPPKVFWIAMWAFCTLSLPGVAWFLAVRIIEATRLKQNFQSDRIQLDLFTSIAAGVRMVAWPLVFNPLSGVVGGLYLAVYLENPEDPVMIGLVGLLLGMGAFLFPMALVHMTARYTYKGWILWEMLKILPKSLGGLLFVHALALVALLPVLLVAGPILFVIKGEGGFEDMNPFGSAVVNGITGNIIAWSFDLIGMRAEPDGGMFVASKALLNIGAAFLIVAPIGFLSAFPLIFMMKAIGLFGYYFSTALDLTDRMKQNATATFWVRYLAHSIDNLCIPLAVFLVTSNPKLSKLAMALTGFAVLSYLFAPTAFPGLLAAWYLYSHWMYWTVQESSELMSTLGKDAFGLVVMTDDEKQLSMKQATTKWVIRIISDLLVGLPYLMAAFSPDKRTLHDQSTKTKVVWKGDR